MNVYVDHAGVVLGHAAGSPRVHFAPDAAITKQWATALWNPSLVPQLDAEIRGYKLKDEHIRQDTVLALAIALEHAAEAYSPRPGRVGKVIYW